MLGIERSLVTMTFSCVRFTGGVFQIDLRGGLLNNRMTIFPILSKRPCYQFSRFMDESNARYCSAHNCSPAAM